MLDLENLLSGDRDSPEQGLVKQRVCFADGVLPGSAVIEDPPVSKYDVIRKNAARRRMIVHKQENESNDGGSSFKTGGNDDENEESKTYSSYWDFEILICEVLIVLFCFSFSMLFRTKFCDFSDRRIFAMY